MKFIHRYQVIAEVKHEFEIKRNKELQRVIKK